MTDNPYDSIVSSDYDSIVKEQVGQQSAAALQAYSDQDPEVLARARQMSQKTGVPTPVIMADPKGFQDTVDQKKNQDIVSQNPAMQSWLVKNPEAAGVAKDDFEKLDTLSQELMDIGGGVGTATEWLPALSKEGVEASSLERQRADLVGAITRGDPDALARQKEIEDRLDALPKDGIAFQAQKFISDMLGSATSKLALGSGATGATFGSIAPGVGTAAGAAAGFLSGFATDAGKVAAANAYLDMAKIQDENGNKLSEPAKIGGSLVIGVGTAILNSIGLGKVGGEFLDGLVKSSLTKPSIANAVTQFGLGITKAGLEGGTINAAQEMVDQFGNYLASQFSSGDFKTILNDPEKLQKAKDSIEQAFVSGAALFAGMHGAFHVPGLGANVFLDRARQLSAESDAASLDKAFKSAHEVKLMERDPELLKQFIAEHGDAPQYVYMPGELAKSVGLDVPAETIATGSDHIMSLHDYLTDVTEQQHQALLPDLRIKEDGLSVNEAAEHSAYPRAETPEQVAARNVPPQEPDTVRFYHAGEDPTSGGPRWATPDENYARNFRNDEGSKTIHYVDIPKGDPTEVEARNWTAQDELEGINNVGSYKHIEIPEEWAKELKPLNEKVSGKELEYKQDNSHAAQEGNRALVVADSAVADTRTSMYLNQLFKDAKSVDMSEPQFNAYARAVQRAVNAAHDKALSIATREAKRRLTETWNKNREAMREDTTNEVLGRRDLSAQDYLLGEKDQRTSGRGDKGKFIKAGILKGNMKLSTKMTEEVALDHNMVGHRDPLTNLPKEMFDKNGVHPDEIAPMFGYDSGGEMLKDLMALRTDRLQNGLETIPHQRQRLVEEALDDKMEKRYGKLDENIADEARIAAANSAQLDVLANETKVLAQLAGWDIPIDRKDIERTTRDLHDDLDIAKASKIRAFERNAGKYGRLAERALLKASPDYATAFQAKQRQMYQLLFAKYATELKKDLESFKKTADKFSKQESVSGVNQDYTNEIQLLLGKMGFSQRHSISDIMAKRGDESLQSFADKKNNSGRSVYVDPFTTRMPDRGQVRPSNEILPNVKVSDMRGLKWTIESLEHNGRKEEAIIKQGVKQTFSELAAEANANMKDQQPAKRMSDSFFPRVIRGIDASLLKMERMMDWFDKNDPNGPFNRIVIRPLAEAKAEMFKWQEKIGKELRKIDVKNKDLLQKIDNHELYDTDTGELRQLNRGELRGIMLHMGSESNFDKMVRGMNTKLPAEKFWTRDAVERLVKDNATKKDWDHVQKLWDLNKVLWPETRDMLHRVTGVAPPEIIPRKISTDFGDYEGGYAHLERDAVRAEIPPDTGGITDPNKTLRAAINSSATKERTGALYPVNLDIEKVPHHMWQMIHDFTHREAVRDAARFFEQPGVMSGVERAFGKEYRDQMIPWLKNIAGNRDWEQAKALSGMNELFRKARMNWTAAQLLFRVSTVLKHGITAAFHSMAEVSQFNGENNVAHGTMHYGVAIRDLLGSDGDKWRKFVKDNSNEISTRMHNLDRDLDYETPHFGEPTKMQSWKYYGGLGVASFDNMSATPLWLAAYRVAIDKGMSHEDAVYVGDKAVRRAHSASGKMDQSAIQGQTTEAMKMMTMAYSFFSHTYNQLRDTGKLANEGGKDLLAGNFSAGSAKFGMALYKSFWYLVMSGMVEELVSPSSKKDPESYFGGLVYKDSDDNWGTWAAKAATRQGLSSIPVVRDVQNMFWSGKAEIDNSPAEDVFKQMYNTISDAYNGKTLTGKGLQHAGNLIGETAGLPGMGQLAATTRFLWDYKEYEQNPETFPEWFRGMYSGHSQPTRAR